VVNYLAEQIEAYLRKQAHFQEWATVRQDVPRGTGDALHACRGQVRSERFLVLNGDDLYGAADLAALAACPAGVLAYPVDDPPNWGIVFRKPDGTLEKLVEKPKLEGRHLANTGVYVFPRAVFDIPLTVSPRGEYEITEAVTKLAERRPVSVVPARFWLPIGNVAAWEKAQTAELETVMRREV
jgi:dTDP-glucose pyrophosphorylase